MPTRGPHCHLFFYPVGFFASTQKGLLEKPWHSLPNANSSELSPLCPPENTSGQYGLAKFFPYAHSFFIHQGLSELSPLAGSIPGPIAFGWVIDKACLLWQDQCGHQGSCFVYRNEAMSRYMLIAGLTFKVRRPSGVWLHSGHHRLSSPSSSYKGTATGLWIP